MIMMITMLMMMMMMMMLTELTLATHKIGKTNQDDALHRLAAARASQTIEDTTLYTNVTLEYTLDGKIRSEVKTSCKRRNCGYRSVISGI